MVVDESFEHDYIANKKKRLKQRYSFGLDIVNIQEILDMGFVIIEIEEEWGLVDTENRHYPTYTITFQEV